MSNIGKLSEIAALLKKKKKEKGVHATLDK